MFCFVFMCLCVFFVCLMNCIETCAYRETKSATTDTTYKSVGHPVSAGSSGLTVPLSCHDVLEG